MSEPAELADVISRLRSGQKVACPKCGAVLTTLPADPSSGASLVLIECPSDRSHYQIVLDPPDRMRAVRARMRQFRSNNKDGDQ